MAAFEVTTANLVDSAPFILDRDGHAATAATIFASFLVDVIRVETDEEMLIDLIQMIREVFDQAGLPCPPGISVECGMDNRTRVSWFLCVLHQPLHTHHTYRVFASTLDGWLMFDCLQYTCLSDVTSNMWQLLSVEVQNVYGDYSEIKYSRVQPVTRFSPPTLINWRPN